MVQFVPLVLARGITGRAWLPPLPSLPAGVCRCGFNPPEPSLLRLSSPSLSPQQRCTSPAASRGPSLGSPNALPSAAQDAIRLLCSKGTLLVQGHLGAHQDPGPFLWSCSPAGRPPHLPGLWGCSSPRAGLRPSPRCASPGSCQPISPARPDPCGAARPAGVQLGVTRRLAEGALCPVLQIANEDIKGDWTQY